MLDATNIWVSSSALEKAITGKTAKAIKRGLPTEGEDEYIDWGWVYATLNERDEKEIKISVQDEESPHHGTTTKLPAESFDNGDILMGNKYTDEEDFDAEENEEDNYPDDLITLTHLHEAEVVHCLRKRYCYDKIYTSTGPILLALNPFKNCKKLYSRKIMETYWERGDLVMNGVDEDNPLPPHVYGIADHSFRQMMLLLEEDDKKSTNQSILVSGESGAGKTVTTKFIMQYLAALSQRSTSSATKSDAKDGTPSVEQQVLQSNPILESFGNARTIRNDNSSRFGKFIEIKFSKTGSLMGASIETYLLEKVRLISQSEGERNYHIFYELFCMDEGDLEKYNMEIYNPEDFRMTNQSGTYDRRDGVEDFETFDDLKKAMEIQGMTEEEQDDVMKIPAAALHGSNVSFREVSNDESELDTENPHLEPFLKLMGLSKDALQKAICFLKIKAGKEFHMRTLSRAKAEKGMEALIKAFYGALFTFLVKRVNSSITVKDDSTKGRRNRVSTSNQATIGVLDIFGFESFKHNSFEQLCINYCNEALQQQFNRFVLKNEQKEYDKEGIKWSFISFPDNEEVLELIDKKGSGILNILDDQCRAPGTTDKTFCIDIYKKCTGHPRFEADFRQVGAQLFGVKHYAGPVEYSSEGFVEKNRDELPKEAADLLLASTSEIVQELASIISNPSPSNSSGPSKSPTRGGASRKITVGIQFSRQLKELRDKIDITSPHYVRCLKPNDLLVPDHFNPLIICDQLRYAGVIEAVRVSRVGYPHRYIHNAFVARYRVLALMELKKAQRGSKRIKPVNVVVDAIAKKLWKAQCEKEEDGEDSKKECKPDLISVGIQVGKTKVFLRRPAYETLEQLRSGKNGESAVLIQKIGRGYIDRRDYLYFLSQAVKVQCFARTWKAKSVVQDKRINYRATLIQTQWRRCVKQKVYLASLAMAQWTQRMQRGRQGRCRYNDLNRIRKAIVVQKNWRSFCANRRFNRCVSAILCIQCATRCRAARQHFKSLKLKARDLGSAVAERDTLRKEAQQLRLQLKEARAAASSVSASTEELEAAQLQSRKLEKEVEELKQMLDDSNVKNQECEKRLDSMEKSLKESEAKAEEQNTIIEDYQSKMVINQEEKKNISEELKQKDEEIQSLKENLSAATSRLETKQDSEKEEVNNLQSNLSAAQKELELAEQRTIDLSENLEQMTEERDDLIKQLKASQVNHENYSNSVPSKELDIALETIENLEEQVRELAIANDDVNKAKEPLNEENLIASAELDAANQTIRELEEKLKKASSSQTSQSSETSIEKYTEKYSRVKKEMKELKEKSANELRMRDKELKSLKAELKAALDASATDSKPKAEESTANEQMAIEIRTLEDEVARLNRELADTKKTNQSAGEIDPRSVDEMKIRYEELSRLSLALLDKDREIADLKVRLLDAQQSHTYGQSILSPSTPSSELRRGNNGGGLWGLMNAVFEDPPDSFDENEGTAEEQVNALKNANNKLKEELKKSQKKNLQLQKDLDKERETAKRELESFAKTLQGVDELRSAAETMSRQVNRYNKKSLSTLPEDEIVDRKKVKDNLKMLKKTQQHFEHGTGSGGSVWNLLDGLVGGKKEEPDTHLEYAMQETLNDSSYEDYKKIKKAKARRKKLNKDSSEQTIVSSFL
mmetsp:Transcript_12284/g.18839  ORF Transcript_12284/g.18839 Transcript_12284/m.18839 type:complete len:1648 (+) Transcript_12284:99-5042(+)